MNPLTAVDPLLPVTFDRARAAMQRKADGRMARRVNGLHCFFRGAPPSLTSVSCGLHFVGEKDV